MFSPEELHRYSKQLKLPEWNIQEQSKLASSTILVVGAGGLACGALPYLVSAGIGKIILIDGDSIDLSNLARQVLYSTHEVGQKKVKIALEKMSKLNPHCDLEGIEKNLTRENADELIAAVDLVVDCTDNFATRYLINDTCLRYDKPFVYAAIHSWEGLISLCNGDVFGEDRKGPTYRCFFPEEPGLDEIPNCDDAGVLGFLPGMMGIMQAKEAIYYLVAWASPANGALGRFDANEFSMRFFKMNRSANAEKFGERPDEVNWEMVHDVDPDVASEWLKDGKLDYILDVREPEEFELASIPGAIQLSMGEVLNKVSLLPTGKKGLVLCHHGMRSAYVIKQLQKHFQTPNLFNLKGGIDAWSIHVDENVPRYY
ncbi:thiamine biosynthesis protein ThiF [Sandaracinomonas limnophila]|uniref:Thiamine biosynthesis protein ThiF n=1 Tax=Sandaracinomonas limnophila TaxID=1862386 RepID=A0A437PRP7_9BACT|nr:HesA/MoeB/ThiF family protein [Sandaracinomonas limnophila]RVU24938.1 thiamine biosynthesis protein ThiF [Sandaracinomonas limnophila]